MAKRKRNRKQMSLLSHWVGQLHPATGLKRCNQCNEVKPRGEFQNFGPLTSEKRKGYDKLHPWCNKCKQAGTNEWRTKHLEYHRRWKRRDRQLNPGKAHIAERRRSLRRKGVTPEWYDATLLSQGGKCAICGGNQARRKYFCIDHCHATGKIRGLLCEPCNYALGFFRDNPASLMAAIQYLAAHHAKDIAV